MPRSHIDALHGSRQSRTVLLATDSKHSVIAEITATTSNAIAYTVYGTQSAQRQVMTGLEFNGELREAHLGWYLLGNGYRAYNPTLMRFHSPDSWSPFGKGGLNAYMYCGGEPVMGSDSTGHFNPAKWWRNVKNLLAGTHKQPAFNQLRRSSSTESVPIKTHQSAAMPADITTPVPVATPLPAPRVDRALKPAPPVHRELKPAPPVDRSLKPGKSEKRNISTHHQNARNTFSNPVTPPLSPIPDIGNAISLNAEGTELVDLQKVAEILRDSTKREVP
jgi:RHS repeat-associated protein